MKKVVRLTERDLQRIVKRVIKENEEEWSSSSQELDNEVDFSKMSLVDNSDFQRLVSILRNNPEAAAELENDLEGGMNEDYDYLDYTDAQPKNISKKEYWVRRLSTLGLAGAAASLMGVVMAGGFSAEDVLQMALGMAAGGAALGDTLISTVGRRKRTEESMLNELGGMDDGHPFSGGLNFANLSPEERRSVDRYYRVSDDEDYGSFDDFEEDELRIPDDMPSYKTKYMNNERPLRPRPFKKGQSHRPRS